MKKIASVMVVLTVALTLSGVVATAAAQEDKPYKDGPVTELVYVKVKPGKHDEYMKWLDTVAKPLREAEIKQGILISFKVYSAQPRSPAEPDIVLAETYPNMGALDKSDEMEAIAAKSMGNRAERSKATEARESIREILGSEIVRELILK